MSFAVDGRQYVVVAVGAGSSDAELVALSLASDLPEQHPGALGFSLPSVTARETDGEITLSVVRAGGSDGAVAASVRTAGGTATAGTDYKPVARTLAWAHGDSASRTFTLRLLEDGAGEGPETIELELNDPLGGAALGERRMVVTVEDESDAPTGPIAECVPDATTLCLNDGRFRVRARFATAADEDSAPATGTHLTGDTGYFTFFDPENIEIVLKVLDGCVLNDRYWLYATGLTDVEVELEVADPVTQRRRVITNPLGELFQPVANNQAFACE